MCHGPNETIEQLFSRIHEAAKSAFFGSSTVVGSLSSSPFLSTFSSSWSFSWALHFLRLHLDPCRITQQKNSECTCPKLRAMEEVCEAKDEVCLGGENAEPWISRNCIGSNIHDGLINLGDVFMVLNTQSWPVELRNEEFHFAQCFIQKVDKISKHDIEIQWSFSSTMILRDLACEAE